MEKRKKATINKGRISSRFLLELAVKGAKKKTSGIFFFFCDF